MLSKNRKQIEKLLKPNEEILDFNEGKRLITEFIKNDLLKNSNIEDWKID